MIGKSQAKERLSLLLSSTESTLSLSRAVSTRDQRSPVSGRGSCLCSSPGFPGRRCRPSFKSRESHAGGGSRNGSGAGSGRDCFPCCCAELDVRQPLRRSTPDRRLVDQAPANRRGQKPPGEARWIVAAPRPSAHRSTDGEGTPLSGSHLRARPTSTTRTAPARPCSLPIPRRRPAWLPDRKSRSDRAHDAKAVEQDRIPERRC